MSLSSYLLTLTNHCPVETSWSRRGATPLSHVSHMANLSEIPQTYILGYIHVLDLTIFIFRPTVTWRREDRDSIKLVSGSGAVTGVPEYTGHELSLVSVKREQMGAFLCIANNNVPPAVSRRISLSVHCKYTTLSHLSYFNFPSQTLCLGPKSVGGCSSRH